GGAGDVEAGGHDVDQVPRLAPELVLCGDSGRPVGDEGGADAAFVYPVLVLAEGRVADVRPAAAVGDICVARAGLDVWALARGGAVARRRRDESIGEGLGADRRQRRPVLPRPVDPAFGGNAAHGLGTAAVVLEEEDQGVLELPSPLQLGNDLTHALVHPA